MAMTPEQQAALERARARMAGKAEPGFWQRGAQALDLPGVVAFATGRGDHPAAAMGRQVGTALNLGGESLTFGLVGDEAAAAADAAIGRGGSYEQNLARRRAQERALWDDNPALALGATLAPALIPGLGQASLVSRAPGWAGKAAAGALTGAAAGGLYAGMEGEGGPEKRLDNAATGAGIGAVVGFAIPAVGALAGALARGPATRKAVVEAAKNAPSSGELKALGNALYKQIDDAGVQVKPAAFDDFREKLVEALNTRTGYDNLPGTGVTPRTARVVQTMDEAAAQMAAEPTAALPFKALDQMRRRAGSAAGDFGNRAEQQAGMTVIDALDEFVQRLGPDDLAAGDAAALKTALPKAREVWSRMRKSQTLDDAIDRRDNYLSGGASGLRNQFKNILQNKRLAAQFTDAEKAALRMVTHGNKLDQLVNLAGGGLSQLATIGAGGAAGGIPGAAAGAVVGSGARSLAEALTLRRAETARAAIASGELTSPAVLAQIEDAVRKRALLAQALGFGALPSVSSGPR